MHLHLQMQVQMRHLHLHLIPSRRTHLHLHLHLIHPHLHLHLHLIQMHLIESNANQMRIKCEPSEITPFLDSKVIDCNSWFALALGSSSVQHICLHCLKSQAKPETKPCVNECSQCALNGAFLFALSEGIIDSELVLDCWSMASLST